MYNQLRALLQMRFSIPKERAIHKTLRSFTIAEKSVFYFFASVFFISGLLLLVKVNNTFLVEVPVEGGTLVEGAISNPRFINPVLALSEADRNLTALIYSGLVRINTQGEIVHEIAESVEVSDDGLVYTARLRPDAVFHDGAPITTEDVVFTIQKITDPLIKSPRRGNWDGVTVEKIDDHTITFTLAKPYAPFKENLTVGILPKHIWKNVSAEEFSFSQFNTFPIGSGLYQVANVETNSGGIPNYYKLTPFETASGRKPFIKNLIFKFYPSEEDLLNAYLHNDIESLGGISPENISSLKESSVISSSPLPRVFGIFFNQTEAEVFSSQDVRQALNLATPKEEVVEKVLYGQGIVTNSPFPAGLFAWSNSFEVEDYESRLAKAKEILEEAGWEPNEDGVLEKKSGKDTITMSFSISTGDVPELRQTAEILRDTWNQLGAKVDIKVFESGDLNQNVIRPRSFEALLFGEVVGRDADVYPFWHSSQRSDPGLNIALYANSSVDSLLEKARSTSDMSEREESLREFETELKEDTPAIFLYTPSYLYVVPKKVHNVELGSLAFSQDRFLGIENWYIDTDKIWKIFAN